MGIAANEINVEIISNEGKRGRLADVHLRLACTRGDQRRLTPIKGSLLAFVLQLAHLVWLAKINMVNCLIKKQIICLN